ncbi:hypothetical protein BY458DRAFT_30679 [Sporodiniella umbellata]|nr:hypothetical protein BY458DRAFT_30679 [Sporodiniella umbellata]
MLVQCLSTGDVVAQQAVEKKGWAQHDFNRTLRMTTFGGIFAGPILSTWYRWIDKTIVHRAPSKALLYKVACDQFLFAPCFIGAFFTGQGLFEGKSLDEIREKLTNGYTTALIGNYKIWPAVQLINFYFVPLNYRLMVTNVVALGWNAYLSTINQRS